MGYGNWDRTSFERYSEARGRKVDRDGRVSGDYKNQDMFTARKLDPALDPKNVMRECCDSGEHPETIPVILALDVTGSMGQAAVTPTSPTRRPGTWRPATPAWTAGRGENGAS